MDNQLEQASSRQSQAVTIYDVARAAGVTISTVSKALNGQGRLREETRLRIQEEARKLGFRPNDLAQSLMRGRTNTVGLITTDREGRFSIPLLMGINDMLTAAQISVFLCDTRDDLERERQHIDSILAKRVDGIIVTGWRTDARPPINIGGANIPVIYAYTQVNDGSAFCLLPDDEQGGHLVTERLLQAGRKHFAHITGPFRFEAVQLRERGIRRAMTEYGFRYPEHNVFSGPWRQRWGYEAATMLLDRKQPLDAIICGNDLIASGVIDALRERGIRIPDDIAVVGFDNWEVVAQETRPPLTSVDMNIRALGRAAGQKLLDLMEKPQSEPATGIQRLPCSLMVRRSCGTGPQSDTDTYIFDY